MLKRNYPWFYRCFSHNVIVKVFLSPSAVKFDFKAWRLVANAKYKDF